MQLFGPKIPRENVAFVRYDPATGAITGNGHTSAVAFHRMVEESPDSFLVGDGDHRTHYVDLATLEIVPRRAFPGVLSGLTLSDLPVPCTVEIGLAVDTPNGPQLLHDPAGVYTVDDGVLEMSFAHRGRYIVLATAVGFLDGRYEVTP